MTPLGNAISGCVFRVKGASQGTGYSIAPKLVATAHHVVIGRKSVRIEPVEGPSINATIVLKDTEQDIAILEIPDRPNWMALGESRTLDEPCLVIGFPKSRFEYIECWVEGVRGASESELKFRTGQFEPGISGAPVVSRRTGAVLGTVRVTRDRSSTLGGIAIPSSRLISIRPDIVDTQTNELEQRWRSIAENDRREEERLSETLPDPTWLTALPPSDESFFGRADELAQLSLLSPQLLCVIAGRRLTGKTELVAEHLRRIHSRRASTRNLLRPTLAYVNMQHYICDENIFLRAVSTQMNLSAPTSQIFPPLPEERVAALANSLAAAVDGRSLWMAIDHADRYLEQPAGNASFSTLLTILPVKALRLLLPLASGRSVSQTALGYATPIELAELDQDAVTEMISHELTCSSAEAIKIATQLDPARQIIGPLRRALRSVHQATNRDTSLASAVEIERALDHAAIQNLLLYLCGGGISANAREYLIEAIAMAAIGLQSAPISETDIESNDREVLDGTGAWEVVIFDHASELLVQLAESTAATTDAVDAILCKIVDSPQFDVVSRANVEYLLDALQEGSSELRLTLRAKIADRLTVLSAAEPLGPVYTYQADLSLEAPLTSFLIAARNSRSPDDFLRKIIGMVDLVGPKLMAPAALGVARQALREVEARFDHHASINSARGLLLERLDEGVIAQARIGQVHFFLDQARSCQILGQYSLAASYRQASSNLIWNPEFEWPNDQVLLDDYELALSRHVVLDLQASEGNDFRIDNCFRSLSRLVRIAGYQLDAGYLLVELALGVLALRQNRDDVLRYLQGVTEQILYGVTGDDVRVRVSARLAAATREIAIRITRGHERTELLRRAVGLLSDYVAHMRTLSEYSDNRALTTYCRCLLSLSSSIAHSDLNYTEATRLRSDALKLLKWVCEHYPSSATWLVYLQALDQDAPEALEWDESAEQLTPVEKQTVAEGLSQYARWRRKRRGRVTARDWKVEAWAIERRWRMEGSLITICAADDPERWRTTPNWRKHELVEEQYRRRRSTITRQIAATGRSPEISLLEVRNEGQYQRLRALYLREPVDDRSVFEVFLRAEKDLGRLPRLELAKGSYYHYIWRFETAAHIYGRLRRSTRDRVVDREARIGQAGALLSQVSYEEVLDPSEISSLLSKAISIVWPIRGLDTRAQLICLRAEIEQSQGIASEAVEAVVKALRAHRNYASVVSREAEFLSKVSAKLVTEERDSSLAWATLAERFTEPRILLEFGSALIRIHEVSNAHNTKYLEAALRCLEGARIMSRDSMTGARRPFNMAKALLLAAELARHPNPFEWNSGRTDDQSVTDLVRARRLFQAAHDASVGRFRYVAKAYLNRTRQLDQELTSA